MENTSFANLFEFDDVGKEIKQWAKWIAWILFIGSIVVGIGMIITSIVLLFDSFEFILWASLFFGGFLEIAFGYVAARLEVIVLYGFGELVDQAMQINRRLQPVKTPAAEKTTVPDKVKTMVPERERIVVADTTKRTDGHKWRCPTCNRMIHEDPCPYCEPMWNDVVEVERNDMNWTCPKCGTKNLNSRTDCWRCEYKVK